MTTELTWTTRDATTLTDPYPAYQQLRHEAPWFDHPDGYTVVSRHADVMALLADKAIGYEDDPVAGVESRTGAGAFASNIGSWLLSMNDPRHAALRRLIGPAFMPRKVELLRERTKTIVSEAFDTLERAGKGEGLQDLAFEVPSRVICQLMGISAEERPRLAALTADVAAVLFEATPTPEMVAAANAAVAEIDTFFEAQVEARRSRPGDDLISTMVQVADGSDDVTEYELLANVHFMYGAGYEETHCFIASGIFHLLTNPDLVTRLRTDDDGGAAVQQELLRYDTPLQSTLRTVREACEVNGHALAAGQSLQLLLGSANRDELAFPDPDRLIVDRPAEPRIASFGGGNHHCAGHPLARMVSMEVFQELVRRPIHLGVPAEAIAWRPGNVYRCLQSLPLSTTR